MTRFILVDEKGSPYVDPFTSKKAIFETQNQAMILSMMIFDQHDRVLKVEALK